MAKPKHVTFQTAATAFDIPETTLRDKLSQKEIPAWLIKKAQRWYVNLDHPAWRDYVEARKVKTETENATLAGGLDPNNDNEMVELYNKSKAAKLNEQILKTEKLAYAVEKERLALQSAAKEVVEVGFAEFLWYGYMERINVDMLGMMKRLAPIIDNLVKAGDSDKVRHRIEKEITAIIKDIKDAQRKEAIKWRRESSS